MVLFVILITAVLSLAIQTIFFKVQSAAEVGGMCRIETNPQGGTRVSVRLPCLGIADY